MHVSAIHDMIDDQTQWSLKFSMFISTLQNYICRYVNIMITFGKADNI